MHASIRVLAAAVAIAGGGCSSTYYNTMEKFGFAKRDILVDRVEKTREAQAQAKEQFASALERFLAVTNAEGGELQQKFDQLNREFSRSEARAKAVHDRIASVEDVAEALFREWKQELSQYTNASLRTESQRQLDATRRNYEDLIRVMRRAAERMDPVLATFRDQVLFLKHNLNARALATLGTTKRTLEADISRLIADMETSIREAENFIRQMRSGT
jgi:Skp family chaperone for outer membrane proteins